MDNNGITGGGSGQLLIPDLIMIAGFVEHDKAPIDHDSWKGALNWYMTAYDSHNENTYHDAPALSFIESWLGNDFMGNYSFHEPQPFNGFQAGLGGGGLTTTQVDTTVFSGTAASGNAWTVDINGTEHRVYHGMTMVDGGSLGATLSDWSDEFADLIEAGDEADYVAATIDGASLIVTGTAGVTGSFSFSIYPSSFKVDLKRFACSPSVVNDGE